MGVYFVMDLKNNLWLIKFVPFFQSLILKNLSLTLLAPIAHSAPVPLLPAAFLSSLISSHTPSCAIL